MTKLPRERRAVVYQGYQWNPDTRTVDDVWAAWHECEPGRYRHWNEILRTWHNAFWAADHHVRYDCGRREQSSGSYIPPGIDTGKRGSVLQGRPDPWGLENEPSSGGYTIGSWGGDIPEREVSSGKYAVPRGYESEAAYEGGMQGDPHPSDMGNPPGAESADDPWTGFPLEGLHIRWVPRQGYAKGGYVGGSAGYARGGWASGGCA